MNRNSFTIILLVLIGFLASYQYLHTNAADERYRSTEYDDLLMWAAPLQRCIVDIDDERSPGRTPILGTDKFGSNIAFRLSVALTTNMGFAVIGALIPFLIFGIGAGIIIGYDRVPIEIAFKENNRPYYRFWQIAISWITEAIHSIPLLLLLLVAVIVTYKTLDNDYARMMTVMIFVGFLSSPKLALLIRDRISILEREEFIMAARASGLSDSSIIFKHVLRYDMASMIMSQVVFILVQSVMLETVISFLGYGIRSGKYESIGKMVVEYQHDLPVSGGGELLAIWPLAVLVLLSLSGDLLISSIEEPEYE